MLSTMSSKRWRGSIGLAVLLFAGVGCEGDTGTNPPLGTPTPPTAPARTFVMGWSPGPPRLDIDLFFQVVDSLTQVAEATILQQPVPWPELLAGAPMDSLVEDRGVLADFLRLKGFQIVFLVDPLDGLDRRKEDPELVALGRSILEPEIRALHEEWVRRIASRVHPRWFGLASEINTLAAVGDPVLYAAVLDLVNTLAPQVRQLSPGSSVFVSFQADQANGRLGDPIIDHFALIDDFDIDALGLSSYPVFAFAAPADVPDDYFTPFDDATNLPLLYVEGGWSSENVPWGSGSPQAQADYFKRYESLLDGIGAELWVMLTFTDLDIPSFGLPPDRALTLSNFAFMGILDTELRRKPSYAEWARIFDRPLSP